MIPLHLTLSGFLSYRDPVELDFTGFELACISGSNGAGKSSLLDAITWALFGQARKHDEAVINSHPEVKAALVKLIFAYEGNIYKVQRALPRGKTTQLEFQILQSPPPNALANPAACLRAPSSAWRGLNERAVRETQARIEQTLRLDYETFVNASFFLQGKADQFTQQRPGDRKRILSSILGLEVWDAYRQRAADRRKGLESEIASIDGRLAEINAELAEEVARKARLAELDGDLERLAAARQTQETALGQVRQVAAALAEQRKLVEALERQAAAARLRLDNLDLRLAERRDEHAALTGALAHADEIEAAYTAWQTARQTAERLEAVAGQVRAQERRRQAPLDEINAARARLLQARSGLLEQEGALIAQQPAAEGWQVEWELTDKLRRQAEVDIQRRQALEAELETARQRLAEARAENPRLKVEMEELKERIDQLTETESPLCPLCGQPLEPAERQALIERLAQQGRELGDRYRANAALLRDADQTVNDLELRRLELGQAEGDLRLHRETLARLEVRLEQQRQARQEWEAAGAPRLAEINASLAAEDFAPQARQALAAIDAELKLLGYDAAAHDAARQAAADLTDDEAQRSLEKARAALTPLERELNELAGQRQELAAEAERQAQEHAQAAAALAEAAANAPDLPTAEQALLAAREQENRLRQEVGAARQKVLVLDDLKARRRSLEAQRETQSRQVAQYKQLERAFSKDGVPAVLIEQALPQIEAKANDLLDRLSGGLMAVRFVTQSAYKDKSRADMKETLDIQISDSAGTRDYELFSGGEAFRVNFAIRLALSEVLAQRAGARLQTLVIDEGFGSQDTQGRQRLIEAINLVRPDFAKILVITHIDELKDAFPNRIEVEKTERGSMIKVI